MISLYERKKRKYDKGIQKSTMSNIHNIEARMNSSCASATPSAMSKTRPGITVEIEKLL
jgi:hypothetical protein